MSPLSRMALALSLPKTEQVSDSTCLWETLESLHCLTLSEEHCISSVIFGSLPQVHSFSSVLYGFSFKKFLATNNDSGS